MIARHPSSALEMVLSSVIPARGSSPAPTDDAAVLERAREWIAQVLERDVVPVAVRTRPGGEEVGVVALEATGLPVLVVGLDRLGSAELVEALGWAASLRALAWEEIVGWAGRREKAVGADWWRLRRGAAASSTPAPALVLLAGTVTDEVTRSLPLLADVRVHVLEAKAPAKGRTPAKETGAKEAGAKSATAKPVAARATATKAAAAKAESTAKPEQAAKPEPKAARRPRTSSQATEHENLQAVVTLVGEASLVLAGAGDGVSGRLLADGTIVVDGDPYSDPGQAAAAALGRPVADGWAAWRFGADGPFLGEALQEALTRPARPARGNRRRAVRD